MKKWINEIYESNVWKYSVTWYSKEYRGTFENQIGERIIELLSNLCVNLNVKLIMSEAGPDYVRFIIGSETQLNISKLIKNMQKKLTKVLFDEFTDLKCQGTEICDDMCLICTIYDGQAKENARLDNILKSIVSVDYYDLDERISTETDKLIKYLSDRRLGIFR